MKYVAILVCLFALSGFAAPAEQPQPVTVVEATPTYAYATHVAMGRPPLASLIPNLP